MSLTTPGCGMKAMSGVSPAWILVMISWLMFSTFFQSMVMPSASTLASSAFSRPSWTGWSMLLQMVTVSPSEPPPSSPPHAVRLNEAAMAATPSSDVLFLTGNRILGVLLVSRGGAAPSWSVATGASLGLPIRPRM